MLSMHSSGGMAPPNITKPPPPVPPRPPKSVVQEALAKSRIYQGESKSRAAPVPPPPINRPLPEIKKNTPVVKKSAPRIPSPLYDTIELDKVSSRPVVYQSENLRKPERILTDRNYVDTTKKPVAKQDDLSNDIKKPIKTESFKIIGDVKRNINRIDSFNHANPQNVDVKKPVFKTDSFKINGDVNRTTNRTDSIKKPATNIKNSVNRIDSFKNPESNIKKPINRIDSFNNSESNIHGFIKLPRVNSFKTTPDVKKTSSLKRSNSKKFDTDLLIGCKAIIADERIDLKEDVNEGTEVRTDILIENGSFDEDSKSQTSTLDKSTVSSKDSVISTSSSQASSLESKNWDKMLQDKNHVNTLIDEMFASVLDVSDDKIKKDANDNKIVIPNTMADNISINTKSADNLTVIVISDDSSDDSKSFSSSSKSNSSTNERKTKFNDSMNHEFLIQELQNMKNDQDKILKRQRMPSLNFYGDNTTETVTVNGADNKIHTSDWFGVSEEGKEVRMSSCHITIEDAKKDRDWRGGEESMKLDFDRISKMSQFHGLPPLPKSLSGFSFMDHHPYPTPPTPVRTSSMRVNQGPQLTPTHLGGGGTNSAHSPHSKMNGEGKKVSTLDAQLAILRREMYSLRQQDLSLLSQLWSLNESIQDFRQMLQDQEDRVLSPPSPSPTQSSLEDDEEYYMSAQSMGFRPSPMVSRKLSGSSGASGSVG